MAWLAQALIQKARCPSCGWEWRDLSGHAGIGAFFSQRHCPRRSCGAQVIHVYYSERVEDGRPRSRLLGSILLRGQNEADLRRALMALRRTPAGNRLTDDAIELLVYSALQLAEAVPA